MKNWLTKSGILASITLGASILFCLSYSYLVYPVVFLILGSLLSKLNKGVIEHDDSTGRNAWQVLANGGMGLLCCYAYCATQRPEFLGAFIVSFSIANSDTFSSEIGRYYKGQTFDVLSIKKVPTGLSGGISWQGSFGGLVGCLIIGTCAFALGHASISSALIIALFGFLGMLTDSILGSGLQAKYKINNQLLETGNRSQLVKGYYWIDNNMVNFMSIALVSILYLLII